MLPLTWSFVLAAEVVARGHVSIIRPVNLALTRPVYMLASYDLEHSRGLNTSIENLK